MLENRDVFLWDVKDLEVKKRSVRINIDFDFGTFVKWSPDSKAFIVNKHHENTLEVYKVVKKKDWLGSATKALTFPKVHEEDVIGIGIANSGKFMMSCSNKTDLTVWDLKGNVLASIDTYLMNTTCAKISPCGRYIVASGFAPDAKVWEVIFNKSGEFVEVKRVYELTGHSSGIYDVAVNCDSSRMATVSKDGTWRLYDTKIEYKRGEDPHLLLNGKYEQAAGHALIALSPYADVLVIAAGNSLAFYSTITAGDPYSTIEDIGNDNIKAILFDWTGKLLFVAVDKQILVFHNFRQGLN